MTHAKYSAFSSSWEYKYHSLPLSYTPCFSNEKKKKIMCVSLDEKEKIHKEELAFPEMTFMLFNVHFI